MSVFFTHIRTWGNGLALRIPKPMSTEAGVVVGTPVVVTAKPGCIVIETKTEPTLEQMLAAFDPKRHGGEVMGTGSAVVEVFARSQVKI